MEAAPAEKTKSRLGQLPLLAKIDRSGCNLRVGLGCRTNFDDHQRLAIMGDQIQLAQTVVDVRPENVPAELPEELRGGFLGTLAEPASPESPVAKLGRRGEAGNVHYFLDVSALALRLAARLLSPVVAVCSRATAALTAAASCEAFAAEVSSIV